MTAYDWWKTGGSSPGSGNVGLEWEEDLPDTEPFDQEEDDETDDGH